jgi:hypothetical protein
VSRQYPDPREYHDKPAEPPGLAASIVMADMQRRGLPVTGTPPVVQVTGIDKELYVRGWTVSETVDLYRWCRDNPTKPMIDAVLIARSLCDENGVLLLKPADVPMVVTTMGKYLKALIEIIMKINAA